jgi:hypothetical protein
MSSQPNPNDSNKQESIGNRVRMYCQSMSTAVTVATWCLVLSLASLGICAGYAGCAFSKRQAYLTMAWCLAFEAAGATIGFLFGIPKAYREKQAEANGKGNPTSPAPTVLGVANARPSPSVQTNTNLEEISDWLTRMLVGVGLVELKSLYQPIMKLAMLISTGLGAPDGAARGFALAILVLFCSLGFLFGYLITRLYLQSKFNEVDQALFGFAPLTPFQSPVVDKALKGKFRATERNESGPAQLTAQGLSSDEAQKQWDSDPNQGKFGGRRDANGRLLDAMLVPAPEFEDGVCIVRLRVFSIDPNKPLRGSVTFHLHPTFSPDVVTVPVDAIGVAALLFLSWGGFTVGAECDGGATRLEIDLGRVSGGTAAFYAQ